MTEVFYVEDDKNIAQIVKEYLQNKNCIVSIFPTITEAENALQDHLPVIFLTVREDARDRMMVFCGGEAVNLSQSEYQRLLLLMINRGKTLTRERLCWEVSAGKSQRSSQRQGRWYWIS